MFEVTEMVWIAGGRIAQEQEQRLHVAVVRCRPQLTSGEDDALLLLDGKASGEHY